MKNKKIGLLFTFVALAIFSVVFVSAAFDPVITSPVTWGNYTGTINIVVTTTDALNASASNVTLYCNRSGGAVDARLATDLIRKITPSDASNKNFTALAVSISAYNSLIANCSAYADNNSVGTEQYSAAVKNMTFDSTSPVCSISVTYPQIHTTGPQTITWSVTDALSLVGNNEYINRPSPGTQLSYTTAVTTVTLSALNTSYVGDWGLNAYGIDRAGNTCNATTTFISDRPGGTVTISDGLQPEQQPNYGILVVIGIVIAIIYFASKKK